MFVVEGIRVDLHTAPPVYAPGGPVAFVHDTTVALTDALLSAIESEAIVQKAVLVVVPCLTSHMQREALLRARDYTFASSWYLGTPGMVEAPTSCLTIRLATATDVPRLLEIGETKREQYETFSPLFWKKAPTPREEFAPYITSLVESDTNIALVAERYGVVHGYLIAQCGNPAEGYVDDYAVADPEKDWDSVGVALLSEAGRLAKERHVATIMTVTGHADAAKRATDEALGYVLQQNWLVKPL